MLEAEALHDEEPTLTDQISATVVLCLGIGIAVGVLGSLSLRAIILTSAGAFFPVVTTRVLYSMLSSDKQRRRKLKRRTRRTKRRLARAERALRVEFLEETPRPQLQANNQAPGSESEPI